MRLARFDNRDRVRLFEKLSLEGAQAGLSWRTILNKREGYRACFAGFDPAKVARFSARDVTRLMADTGIVRNRAKIEATIGNARAFLELPDFARFCWSFVGDKPKQNRFGPRSKIPAATDESRALSKALVEHGFRFVGPTIVYAWMQACGLVNDHLTTCFRYDEVGQMSVSPRQP